VRDAKILGLSSATNTVGAAIIDGDCVISECSVTGDRARSERLISLVDEVIEKAGLDIKKIDAVAVATGPGSYSGLRGGLATAKALTAVLNKPIISVATLDAAAYNYIGHNGTVLVALNACRDDYNMALFGFENGLMKRLTKDITVKLSKIKEVVSQVKGELTVAIDNAIPLAKNVAILGLAKLKNGETEDYLTLVPEYSHKPNIREYAK
jgi:tRNA threonylcarbamoyladenosine biosynthesis protein TsaB